MMIAEFFVKKIKHLFDAYDVDQNGIIEFNDFHAAIERMCDILGVSHTSLAYQSLMAVNTKHWELLTTLADANLDDVITREEFLNWAIMANDMRDDADVRHAFEEWIFGIFDLLDVDGNGHITFREYQIFLRSHNHRYSQDELKYIWLQLDINGDNVVSFGEAVTLLMQFFFSTDETDRGNWFYGIIR